MGLAAHEDQTWQGAAAAARLGARLGGLRGHARRAWAALRRAPASGDDPESRLIHDLRTPLTSIRSFSEVLRHHPDLSQVQRARYLDIILSEGRRLERAIADFEARTGSGPAR